MDCSPPGSSVHGILQARILEWIAMPSFRGSSWTRNRTCVSCISCIVGGFFPVEPPGRPPLVLNPSGQPLAMAPGSLPSTYCLPWNEGHRSVAQAAVLVMSRLTESGVFRGNFHVGVSDVGLLQNHRELVKIPTDVRDSWSCPLPPFFFFLTYPSKTFIYLSLAALDLHCCARAFSSCGEQGLLSTFSVWASHCAGLLL